MSEWTVVRSGEFATNLARCVSVFEDETLRILSGPRNDRYYRRGVEEDHFLEFTDLIDGLLAAELNPCDHLAYVEGDLNGVSIYSAVVTGWRCLYQVDRVKKTCTELRVEEISDSLQRVEAARHIKTNRLRCTK